MAGATDRFKTAVIQDDFESVKQSLLNGADPNVDLINGKRAIHFAIGLEDINLFQLLLEYHCDINIQDQNGDSPLMLACFAGNRAMVDTLIQHGANLNLRNNNKMSAAAWAEEGGSPELSQYLQACGAEDPYQNTPLHSFFEKNDLDSFTEKEIIEKLGQLVASGIDVNVQSIFGITPLMLAAAKGNRFAVRALLHLGADLTLTDQEGGTAALWAKEEGHDSLLDLLE